MSGIAHGCPYCRKPMDLTTAGALYSNASPTWADRDYWACLKCEAWIGCHPNSTRPLGIAANAPLRRLRREVHKTFDPLWQTKKFDRKTAYRGLAVAMELPPEECHVSLFDPEMCDLALALLKSGEVEAACQEIAAKNLSNVLS